MPLNRRAPRQPHAGKGRRLRLLCKLTTARALEGTHVHVHTRHARVYEGAAACVLHCEGARARTPDACRRPDLGFHCALLCDVCAWQAPVNLQHKRTYIDDWYALHGADYSPPAEPPPGVHLHGGGVANPNFSPSYAASPEMLQQHIMPQSAAAPADPARAATSAGSPSAHSNGFPASTAILSGLDDVTTLLVGEVRRSYASGATEQQLHSLAATVAANNGMTLPSGGATPSDARVPRGDAHAASVCVGAHGHA